MDIALLCIVTLMFRAFAFWLVLVLAVPQASGQHAVRAVADLPEDVHFALHIEGGWALVQQNLEMAKRLRSWGLAEETLPAFNELAERLDEPPAIAFERLLGRRVTLAVRLEDEETRWVVMSEVDQETASALPLKLKAQPRRVSSTLAVQALERRSFDFTVSPINPATNTAWIILGPERAGALFDAVVGTLMGVPGGGDRLGKGKDVALFEGEPQARVAFFYRDVEDPGAMLAWAQRDADAWDIGARASTAEAWMKGLGLVPAERPGLRGELPKARPDEVLATWVVDWGEQPVLDSLASLMMGDGLWRAVSAHRGPLGLEVRSASDAASLVVSAAVDSAQKSLAETDRLLEERLGASGFGGALPAAARSSSASGRFCFDRFKLSSLAWGVVEDGSAISSQAGRQGLRLVLAATDGATPPPAAALSDHLLQPANTGDERVLWMGRVKPAAMAELLRVKPPTDQDRRPAVDRMLDAALTALSAISRVQWRLWETGDQLRATLRIELAETPGQ